jgi:lysophospholipase L1-like esterase
VPEFPSAPAAAALACTLLLAFAARAAERLAPSAPSAAHAEDGGTAAAGNRPPPSTALAPAVPSPAAPAPDNASPKPPEEPRVVFLGDSITQGWQQQVPSFFSGRPWLGRGVSGQTSAQLLLRFRRDVIDARAQVVVILAGTNDVAENGGPYDEDETVGHLASMLDLAKANGIRAVLCSVLPARLIAWRPAVVAAPKIIALNARLEALAGRTGAVWLDYHRAMSDAEGKLPVGLGEDGVHPNQAGYAVMGPLAEEAVRKALANR